MTNDRAFQKFAGMLAVLAGVAGFLYSVSFIIIARSSPELGASLSAFFLLLGGVLTGGALVGLYKRLEAGDNGQCWHGYPRCFPWRRWARRYTAATTSPTPSTRPRATSRRWLTCPIRSIRVAC
ncbi:MAG: hypothetical protein U0703_08760 [Anaerolineae bacterium]